jgi:transcriptional regulator with XRE-family HTH domain
MKSRNPIDQRVGRRIHSRRVALEMSGEEFAVKLGVPVLQVRQWESGLARVGASQLLNIIRILDVSLTSLFDAESSDEPMSPSSAVEQLPESTIVEFQSSAETMRLLRIFSSLKDPALRQVILDLVENLVRREREGEPSR